MIAYHPDAGDDGTQRAEVINMKARDLRMEEK
jgi:hypothetical protein